MKALTAICMGLACVVFASAAFAAQESKATSNQPTAQGQTGQSVTTPQGAVSAPGSQTMPSKQDMEKNWKQAGMPENMQLQAKYMMFAEVKPFDPAHVMAIQPDLKLTPDQMAKLQEIANRGMEETKAILNDEQKKMVQQMRPMTEAQAQQEFGPYMRANLAQRETTQGPANR